MINHRSLDVFSSDEILVIPAKVDLFDHSFVGPRPDDEGAIHGGGDEEEGVGRVEREGSNGMGMAGSLVGDVGLRKGGDEWVRGRSEGMDGDSGVVCFEVEPVGVRAERRRSELLKNLDALHCGLRMKSVKRKKEQNHRHTFHLH